MRYRITIRGDGAELRGYITAPTHEALTVAAQAVQPIGMMIASPAENDFNPFAISEPEHPPTPDASIDIIRGMWESSEDPEDFITQMSMMHFAQANVIRGERGRAERAEKELLSRELHHFEAEEKIAFLTESRIPALEADAAALQRIKDARSNHPDLPVCEKYPDPEDFVKCGWRSTVEDIDKVLADVPD